MRAIRDNWAFILLLLIALLLVFLLIGLQSAILSNQQDPTNTENKGFLYVLRQQIAWMIAPPTDTPPPTTPLPPTATPLPPPATATSLPPPPTLTPVPLPATDTPAPALLLLPTATPVVLPTNPPVVPTATPVVLPTPTAAAPEVTPVAASNNLSTTQVTALRVDFRIGYLDRQDGCPFVTEVVRLVLERNLNFTVEMIPYSNVDQLYLALAATDEARRLDLTVCYTDPIDRPYLEKHFGFVILVGSTYRQFDNKSFLILSNAAVKKVIQREQPCMYNFLTKLKIDNADFQNPDAARWYEAHSELARSWTTCE